MSQHLAVELLSSYVDEEVTPAQVRLVEQHLGGCTECRRTLAGLRAVAEGVGRLEAVAPPPTLSAAVERRVRLATLDGSSAFGFEDRLRRWLGQPVLAPAFATVLALAAIIYLFAFGVSKGSRHTTRVIVASAPSEEGMESFERPQDSAAGPVSGTDLDHLGSDDVQATDQVEPAEALGSNAPAVGQSVAAVPPEATTSPESVVPASAVAVGRFAEERRSLASKLEQVQPEIAETASPEETVLADAAEATEQDLAEVAGARGKGRKRSATVVEPSQAMAKGSLAGGASEVRELGGRRFFEEADLWVELGLEGRTAVELIDLRLDSTLLDAELAVFRDLERVRLRIDDRIVEVIYPATESPD